MADMKPTMRLRWANKPIEMHPNSAIGPGGVPTVKVLQQWWERKYDRELSENELREGEWRDVPLEGGTT